MNKSMYTNVQMFVVGKNSYLFIYYFMDQKYSKNCEMG